MICPNFHVGDIRLIKKLVAQVVTYSLKPLPQYHLYQEMKNHRLSTYITNYSCLYHYLNTFINHCRNERNKSADALAYGIYMAAAFHKSQQPNRNLHFSPSNPHTKKIGKKWNTNSKVKKKKEIKEKWYQKKKRQSNPSKFSLLYQALLLSILYKNKSQC